MSNGAPDGSGAVLALAQQVRTLQAQVAALAGQTTGEALVPNYLTVDPQGRTGAAFSGLINALGLILPMEEDFTVSPVNEITWQSTTDGAQLAHIQADEGFSGVHQLFLNLIAQPRSGGGDGATISLEALNDLNQFGAELNVSTANSGGAADAITFQTAHTAGTIIDDLGDSSFVTWADNNTGVFPPRKRSLDFGVSTISTVASVTGLSANIPHNLGRTPIVAFAAGVSGSGVLSIDVNALSSTLVQFSLQYVDGVARTTTNGFFWAVIG